MSFPRQYRHTITGRASAAGDEARARLLEVALELFATAGFRGTSVAQVATRAGLSQAGLLHHFPSKVALLTAALEYRDETEGLRLEVDGVAPLGWAAFDALVDLVARNAQRPHVVRLFVTLGAEALDPEHPAHPWVQDHYESLERWLTAAVEHGRDRGEPRSCASRSRRWTACRSSGSSGACGSTWPPSSATSSTPNVRSGRAKRPPGPARTPTRPRPPASRRGPAG